MKSKTRKKEKEKKKMEINELARKGHRQKEQQADK